MKKLFTISLLFLTAESFAQASSQQLKPLKIEYSLPEWSIYLRNMDRLQAMAGRGNVPSDMLLSTQDTINFFKQTFLLQLRPQMDTAQKKKQ